MTIISAKESGDQAANRYSDVYRITKDQVLAWRKN